MMHRVESRIRDRGGDRWVFDQIAAGVRVVDIASQLGCSRPFMYVWRNRKGFEHRGPAWEEALRESALSRAEDGEEILDVLAGGDPPLASEVQLASARAGHRRWMAEKLDRDRFGQKAQVGVTVTVEGLHLDALRSSGQMITVEAEEESVLAIEGPDVEIMPPGVEGDDVVGELMG